MRWMLCLALLATTALAGDPKPARTPEQAEAEYAAVINKRASDLVTRLDLSDSTKSAAVHDILVAQYRALRNWHDANDARVKELRKSATSEAKAQIETIQATLKPIHDQFLADLGKHLSPEQVDHVKDLLTYNVRNVTYNAYCDEVQTLTDTQKKKIMDWLIEAREIAMDQGSSEEKHAVFGKYKGRINNYLASEGYNMKEQEKAWQARLRERRAAASQKSN